MIHGYQINCSKSQELDLHETWRMVRIKRIAPSVRSDGGGRLAVVLEALVSDDRLHRADGVLAKGELRLGALGLDGEWDVVLDASLLDDEDLQLPWQTELKRISVPDLPDQRQLDLPVVERSPVQIEIHLAADAPARAPEGWWDRVVERCVLRREHIRFAARHRRRVRLELRNLLEIVFQDKELSGEFVAKILGSACSRVRTDGFVPDALGWALKLHMVPIPPALTERMTPEEPSGRNAAAETADLLGDDTRKRRRPRSADRPETQAQAAAE